jgi:hypothetical protein
LTNVNSYWSEAPGVSWGLERLKNSAGGDFELTQRQRKAGVQQAQLSGGEAVPSYPVTWTPPVRVGLQTVLEI